MATTNPDELSNTLFLFTTGNGSIYSPGPEYDDPANCAPEDEQYGSQYYGAPYDQYGSRGSIGRRSLGSLRLQPTSNSPEPPPPPPRNHDPSFNDSKDSNEISEAECDRDQLINNRSYGGKWWKEKKAHGLNNAFVSPFI